MTSSLTALHKKLHNWLKSATHMHLYLRELHAVWMCVGVCVGVCVRGCICVWGGVGVLTLWSVPYSTTVVTRDEVTALQMNIERELERYHAESAQLAQVNMHVRAYKHAHHNTHLVVCMRWVPVHT